MKHNLLIPTCIILIICGTLTISAAVEDSTKVFETGNKRIVVKDNEDKQRVDVQVFELDNETDTTFYEKIFEGHYRNGKSSEHRKYIATIDIPMPGKVKKWKSECFDPHWAGFGMGFANFTNGGDSEDIPLNSSNSLEYNLNIIEKAIPISNHYKWAVVTGFGIRWTRYNIKGNNYFQEIDDYTYLIREEGVKLKKSTLATTSLSIPLLFEWQNPKGNLFFSTGAVGSIKTWSSSKIEYNDETGNKRKKKVDEGMTLRPVTVDWLTQVGMLHWGIYVRYTPMSIFEHKKGPELYPLTIGIMWHLL